MIKIVNNKTGTSITLVEGEGAASFSYRRSSVVEGEGTVSLSKLPDELVIAIGDYIIHFSQRDTEALRKILM